MFFERTRLGTRSSPACSCSRTVRPPNCDPDWPTITRSNLSRFEHMPGVVIGRAHPDFMAEMLQNVGVRFQIQRIGIDQQDLAR